MRIDTWFPKAILVVDNFHSDHLDFYKSKLYCWLDTVGTIRTNIFEVDSTHLTNNKLHTDPMFSTLANSILDQAKIFSKEFGYSDTIIDKLFINSMWANLSREGDYLESHIHQNSFLSGVFYIQSPPKSLICFYDHSDMSMIPEKLTPLSYTIATYDCIPSRLLMWKSNLQHSTPKQPAGVEKLIVSFNIGFKND